MFCDLVGSTALAERLDPEELSDLLRAYQTTAADAVRAFDGHVAQHLGDGLLVYFGYPVAHEDDAQRAVHASLRLLEAMVAVNARLDPTTRLGVRVGIHTGPVVTGDVGTGATTERLALGSTPNIAARLQGLAAPDTVVVSGATLGLLKQAFRVEPIEAGPIKGVSQAIRAFRVVGRLAAPAGAPGSDAAIFGRHAEIERLQQAHAALATGGGSAVLITGEAGLGKSRLAETFARQMQQAPATVWVGQCSPYEQTSALSPIAGVLQQVFDLQDAPTPALHLNRLVSGVTRLGLAPAEIVPLLAGMLSIPLEAPFAPLDITPQKRKAMTLEAIAAVVIRSAEVQPLTWLVEDLHWADPSTLEFFTVLMSRAAGTRLFLVLTARPAFENPWGSRVASIVLQPMDRVDAAALIAHVAAGRPLPAATVDQIIEKTDGVPLFIEELTKTILESSEVGIPTSLQASLTARLDRLGTARDIAQLGSVIGREFSFDMLRAVAPWEDAALVDGLHRLTQSELVYQHGIPPQARYVFKHALVRDAAYEMLLKSARRDHHRRIGMALVERFPQVVAMRPELAAHHFSEAGETLAAIPHWMAAGQKAAGESANVEAIAHLHRALGLISSLPESPERDGLELGVHLLIGPPLTLAKGYVVDEVERTYVRAQDLNARVGDDRQRFWIQLGICQFRAIRGELADSRQGAERLLALADSLGEPVFTARACCILGITSCYSGEFARAADWLDTARANLPSPDVEFLAAAGMDLGALIDMYRAWTRWHLGADDEARDLMQRALAAAASTGRQHAHGHALVFAGAHVSHFLGDVDGLRHYATEAAALSERYGFPVWGLQAGLWIAWLDALGGNSAAARAAAARSRDLFRAYRATGARLALSYFMSLTAETLLHAGDLAGAESLVDESLRLSAELPDPIWEPEVHRLKGEIHRRASNPTSAAAHFTRARDAARRHGSRALEARAAASLSRLRPPAPIES
jgi:class 3 adenylate cyclase